MTQTTGRIFDDIARLVTDAAGMAEGARRELETIVRAQMERMLRSMDVVSREEFDAVRDMAAAARDENERLAARIAELEARLARDEQDAAERE
ncbi:accessory factor UbiK family protein [Chelatococcus daeguensis]|uniref:accessory factor UbiK family protein n=1 Tax=Chelatococcus daeguensis TaxID=444444 RepID=UPI0007AC1D5B|nr:accessory factor UbiK family protein [Chelatococcus daeguensis]KZE27436.1 pyrroline-5-carboxylate reductase [Chelatococcus daeguensis]MBM3085650.1 accessory factor UbiK family protein [Chelatococcus daeguensis]